MRIIKHALLSLRRKPTKALMIFGILLTVFGMIFTGLIIDNSVKEAKNHIRREMGAVVNYLPDYMKAMQDELGDDDYDKVEISMQVAEELAKDEKVKDMYVMWSTYLQAKLKGEYSMEGEDLLYVDVSGSNHPVGLLFEDNIYTLLAGRQISQEEFDSRSKVVLVTKEMAARNNLEIGSTITVVPTENQTEEFEVIGIFEGASEFSKDSIIVSGPVVEELAENMDEEMNMGAQITSVKFLLSDPLEIDNFIERSKGKLPSEYTYLSGRSKQYKKLTKPLDLIEIIIKLLIGVVFIAGAMIILAVVTIFVRDRKFEIGLLLASGESKAKVIGQFLIELLIITVIAFVIAGGISQVSSKYVANWIVENQLVEEETDEIDMDDYFMMDTQKSGKEVDFEDMVDGFEVGMSFSVLIKLLMATFGLVLVAASIPLGIILGYRPRAALQD